MSGLPDELIERAVERVVLDRYCTTTPRFVVVVDADAVLSSVDNQCRTGRTPRMLRLSGASVVLATPQVYAEIYKGFAKLAETSPVTPATMRACFEENYLPVLRWVETDGSGLNDDRVSLVTDETDVPTAELASLIAPCLVLSQDKALRRPGYAPQAWRLAAGHGADVVEGAAARQAAAMVVGLPAVAILGGSIRLGHAVRLPSWSSLMVLAIGGYAVLRKPGRRASLGKAVWPCVEVVGEAMAEAAAREEAGIHGMRKVMFMPSTSTTLKRQIAVVLARTREPLLAREVVELVEQHFDKIWSVAEVRGVLASSPEFTQPERHRWQLGRRSGSAPVHAPSGGLLARGVGALRTGSSE